MQKYVYKTALVTLLFLVSLQSFSKQYVWGQEIRFKWNTIDLNDSTFWKSLQFPKNFSWGVATSAFQIEGGQTHHNRFIENNWTVDFPERYQNNNGCDHWNRWQEDVQHIKNLGVNTYRLSIPWDKIELEEGLFDHEAMQHYVDVCKALKKEGIEPWICLHHFTEPLWFGKKAVDCKGYTLYGFEAKQNIKYFVRFCKYVFDHLNDTVTFWASFNEPVAYAMEGWARGVFPPHKKKSKIPSLTAKVIGNNPITSMAGLVLKNMLIAHVQIYQEFKKINRRAQIGIVHMFHPLDPYSPWNPIDNLCASIGSRIIHDVVLDFFKYGTYNWFYLVKHNDKRAPYALDFIGLNYYRHELVKSNGKTVKARDDEQKVLDTGVAIYPEGLYRCIQKAATLNVPIYISENGIPDKTDTQRNDYIKKHLYVVHKALHEGYDIRGYHYWTLMDSLGWHGEYNKKYGLYEVQPDTKNRVLREGAKPFVSFLHTQKINKETL